MELLARGRTNAEIAEHLEITLDGAKYHVREILGKLGVESREDAAATWQRSRSPGARLQQYGAALASARALPLAWAGAATAFAGIISVVVIMALNRGGGGEPVAPTTESVSPPAPTATAVATTSTPPSSGSIPECTSANASARLELVPDGEDVLIRLSIDGNDRCLLLGPARLFVGPRPPAQGPPMDAYANTDRAFKVAVDLPAPSPLVEWRWKNNCLQGSPLSWSVTVAGLSANVATSGLRPACVAPGAPMVVTLARMQTGADGEATPSDSCKDSVAAWLCEFATRVGVQANRPDLGAIIDAGEITIYTCTDDGHVEGAEFSDICKGHRGGDPVGGYPLALHGSAGGPRSRAAIEAELEGALSSGNQSYLAAIGCPADDPACTTFLLAFATRGSPKVAYLAFRLQPGREPAFIGGGLSGDNAEEILGGGTTRTAIGETTFVAVREPA